MPKMPVFKTTKVDSFGFAAQPMPDGGVAIAIQEMDGHRTEYPFDTSGRRDLLVACLPQDPLERRQLAQELLGSSLILPASENGRTAT
jgi:hypothetical protein